MRLRWRHGRRWPVRWRPQDGGCDPGQLQGLASALGLNPTAGHDARDLRGARPGGRDARDVRLQSGGAETAEGAAGPLETVEIHGEARPAGPNTALEPATVEPRLYRRDPPGRQRTADPGRLPRPEPDRDPAVDRAAGPGRRARRDAPDSREVRRPPGADGSDAARASAQAAALGWPGQGARGSGRAGRVCMDADDEPARARSGRPDDAHDRRRPAGGPSVGLRRFAGRREGHLDQLPASLDRHGQDARTRGSGDRRRARAR